MGRMNADQVREALGSNRELNPWVELAEIAQGSSSDMARLGALRQLLNETARMKRKHAAEDALDEADASFESLLRLMVTDDGLTGGQKLRALELLMQIQEEKREPPKECPECA